MSTTSTSKKKAGEPHRIYWQQWIPASGVNRSSNDTVLQEGESSISDESHQEHWSRKELILSSAAIRLSRSAKVKDVTELLRKTLQLPPLSEEERALHLDPCFSGNDSTFESFHEDCLVLVGSIYSLPKDYVQYEHKKQQQEGVQSAADLSNQSQEQNRIYPFHVVHTLNGTTKPLDAYDAMEKYLNHFMEQWSNNTVFSISKSQTVGLPVSSTPLVPKIQWYYVPTVSTVDYVGSGTLIPNCVELDGYCTSMDDSDQDEDDEDIMSTSSTASDSISGEDLLIDDYDQQRLCATFPWLSLSPSQPIVSKKSKK